MYWVAGTVVLFYLILFFLSRREEAGTGRDGLLGRFDRMSAYLCRKILFRGERARASPQAERCLGSLHPGEDVRRLARQHTIRKLSVPLILFLIGALLGALLHYRAAVDSVIPGGAITRSGILGSAKSVALRTPVGESEEAFEVAVYPLELTPEEAEEAFAKFREVLEETVRAGNPSLSQVREALDLPGELDGYPFEVEWQSSNLALLSASDGAVAEVEEPEEVLLTAAVSYRGYSWEAQWTVTILPREYSGEELLRRGIRELLEASEADSRQEESWELPERYGELPLDWSVSAEDNGLLLWGICAAVSVLLYAMADRDLEKQAEERREQMRRSYPEFARKLALYIGAGMTVRGACFQMAQQEERENFGDGVVSPVYEELGIACREIRSGIPEAEGYERFGRRTGLQEYIRLTSLLTQNLKKGSASLIPRLREEAESATEEQILRCKRAGEEAQTKLLVPMVLMLLVVMVMIMVPAFSTVNL